MTGETGPSTQGPDDQHAIQATVGATGVRRVLGVGMLAGLGGLMLYIALVVPPAVPGWQVFLLAMGAAALLLAHKMWRATQWQLQLADDGLRMSDGTLVAPIDHITRIERGMFAFKPSNGFILYLSEPLGRRWFPGLWWRLGRRVGVGGVTPRPQTKVMADALQMMLAEREAPDAGRVVSSPRQAWARNAVA